MSWSSEYRYTESSFGSEMEFNHGTQKVKVDLESSVEWKKYKAIFTGNVAVKTPFAGYEDNKLDATLEYSAKLFNLVMEGHKGFSANAKKLELYGKTTRTGIDSYMKTDLYR